MGYAKLINLDTGEVETFETVNGVLYIPAGRYAPTLFLDSRSSVAILQDEKNVPAGKHDTLADNSSLRDQQFHRDRP